MNYNTSFILTAKVRDEKKNYRKINVKKYIF